MDRLAELVLRLAVRLAPAAERARWWAEWRADLEAARARGVPRGRRLGWALGLVMASIHFRWEGGMEGWGRELRHALRGLTRNPGFTAVAVLTLALGIGANTAIFSVVNGVLLRPLPYPASGRLVMVTSAFPTMGFEKFWISPPEYVELEERSSSFAALGAFRQTTSSIGGGDEPERVTSAIASAELFEALGTAPLLGRAYTRDEDVDEGPALVVLSWELWQRSFGGDREVVGRTVEVDGTPTTVIGVMPRGFDVDDSGIQAWLPLQLDRSNRRNRGSHYLYLVGRLAGGVSVERGRAELRDLVAHWSELDPGTHVPQPDVHPLHLTTLREEVVGDARKPLLVLLGAVALVLLIACANVANLLLARAEARQREVAVRVAMGAGRGRLLRQFLTEGVVLSLVGAALGMGLAWFALEALRAAGPGSLPRLREVDLDGTVLLFTVAVAVLTGVLFGLAPARHLGRVGGALREGGLRSTGGVGRTRVRSLLVVSEVALAMVLAVGSGLLIRSFRELTRVDPGFDPEAVLTFQLYLPRAGYPEGADVLAFHDRLAAELSSLPGVVSVGAADGLPPERDLNANDTEFEGVERTPEGPPHNVDFYQTANPEYLSTLRIRVVRGRGFLPSDGPDDVPVVLVNETLARVFYPGENPLGRRVRPCCGDEVPWFEIVGVVEDVKQAGLDEPVGTELYFDAAQTSGLGYVPRTMNVFVRTAGRPRALAPSVRQAVWRLDGSLPVADLRTMDEVVARSAAHPRFLTLLLATFAGLALLLAAVGTYGVMSYSVAQRGREIGIRMALGAEADAVRRLVLGQGLAVASVGLGLGLAGALGASRVMGSLLYGVDAHDTTTFVVAPLCLAVVALAACWIPAWRATRVDPAEVLREE